jgi:hypothetical protein
MCAGVYICFWFTQAMDETDAITRMQKAMRGAVLPMRSNLYQHADPEALAWG